ncbi:MAG: heavy metal translocating P-type ATPase [Anaerotignum sp.]
MKEKFNITGMTCSACSAHVEKSVAKLNGVESVNVNLLQNSMLVTFDIEIVDTNAIIQAVKQGGYGASLHSGNQTVTTEQNIATDESKEMKSRLISSFCFLVPLFYIAMGHMLGAPLPSIILGEENTLIFALTQLFLTLPILIINRKYFTVGFRALLNRTPNMDSLIALGSAASVLYSIFAIFAMAYFMGRGDLMSAHHYSKELYFESAAIILTLITLGKYMETRSKGKTSEAISKLMNLAPKTATILKDGLEIEVPIEEVLEGDTIIVRPGHSIPVDGTILEGFSAIDESAITGESMPVEKQAGDMVIGATINKSGFFKMKATRVGTNTTLAQIINLVEEATSSKAPIAKLADRVSGVFVPIVICISILSALIWFFAGQTFAFSLSIGIAVLVISCPCALGLATPTAIMVGTGKGAENGILIKSAESLEIAHKLDTIVLDKTGTLTEGKPKVTDIFLANGVLKNPFLRLVASLESLSEHPLGEAVVAYAKENNISLLSAKNLLATPGQGIEAEIEGKQICGGNLKMMLAKNISLGEYEQIGETLANEGKTPLYFADGDKLLGILALADSLKESSKDAIDALKRMGIHVVMLTGDNQKTADAIAKKLGIHAIADVLPQDKEQEIRRLQELGQKVAMVGDGINDAPALTRADVGIAIGAGTDVALESADIVLMKNNVTDVVTAIQLSHATVRNIKQNLFWAFFYNILGIPLAAGVFYHSFGLKLNPMFAAAAMSFSSVFVVGNALRLRLFQPQQFHSVTTTNPITQEQKEDLTMKKVLIIEGMTCGHCTGRVEKALNALDGVQAILNLEEKSATLTLSNEVSDETLINAVTDAGYEVVDIHS